jgi:hypothetical protein
MTDFLLVWRSCWLFGQRSYIANDRAMTVIRDDVMEPGLLRTPCIYATVTLVATSNYCNSKEREDVQERVRCSTEVSPAYFGDSP